MVKRNWVFWEIFKILQQEFYNVNLEVSELQDKHDILYVSLILK